jgi:hypothetical protein
MTKIICGITTAFFLTNRKSRLGLFQTNIYKNESLVFRMSVRLFICIRRNPGTASFENFYAGEFANYVFNNFHFN